MSEKSLKSKAKTGKAPHEGHRKRLLARVGKEELLEHELLEILLYNALPRRNTNDIAHRLLSAFGSLQEVLQAPLAKLQEVDGVGESVATYLVCLGCVLRRCTEKPQSEKGRKYAPKDFVNYVNEKYKTEGIEVVDAYLLDEDSHIFLKERIQSGDAVHVEFDPTLLAKLLAEHTPSGLVMVHNHPYGAGTPSEKDDEMTKRCQMLCSTHNVVFCDHVIYAPEGVYSYYAQGRMLRISTEYSMDGILGNLGFLEGV